MLVNPTESFTDYYKVVKTSPEFLFRSLTEAEATTSGNPPVEVPCQ